MTVGTRGRMIVLLLLAALVVLFFASSWQLKPEARVAPLFVSSVSLLILVFLFRSEMRAIRKAGNGAKEGGAKEDGEKEQPLAAENYRKLAVVTLWLIATALLMAWFDYVLVIAAMQFILTYFLIRRPLAECVWSTVGITAFVFLVFRLILNVP